MLKALQWQKKYHEQSKPPIGFIGGSTIAVHNDVDGLILSLHKEG
jgi:hypothetical protein